jgi:hypothetical protein
MTRAASPIRAASPTRAIAAMTAMELRLALRRGENLFATIGSGPPHLVFAGHTDVVPVGEGWNTDPFAAEIKDGMLYGRGAADMKSAIAAFVAAVFGADLLWPVFLLLGLEAVRIDPGNTAFTPLDFVSYPWSHSLLMDVIWGALAGSIAMWTLGNARAGVLVGLAVVSHWVLDFASHRPDMPVWPGGPLVGLGLWHSVAATLVVAHDGSWRGLAHYRINNRSRQFLALNRQRACGADRCLPERGELATG